VKSLRSSTADDPQTVECTVRSLDAPAAMRGMVLITFKDMPRLPELKAPRGKGKATVAASNAYIQEREHEWQRTREELRSTREEMQTSQEELSSTNEELQSTNEELTTSKEEMQSINEELQIVNAELQAKVDELSRAASDMRNLLDSTDIATLFLDGDLKVRRFTPKATKIIKLIPGDVGRPITDQATDLDYPTLVDDSREVLRTLVLSEKQIPGHDGRWFTVRIMPYRTIDDRIDGVVITFADVSAHHKALEESEARRGTP